MSRRPLSFRKALAALACAAPLLSPPPAHSDTCTGLSLATLTPAAAGTTPNAVAVGDFDRDGRMDVAVANSGSNEVSILLGDGAGGFTAGPNSPIATGATSPIDIAAGDLDRDGILDLVVGFSSGPARAEVLRGLGGIDAGKFTASGPFPLVAIPTRIHLADITNDAELDLVVLRETLPQRLMVYRGIAGAAFAPTPQSDFDLSVVTEEPSGAVPVDFNRDGNTDLAVVMRNRDWVRVYQGFGANGLGASPVTLTLASTGDAPSDVATGDINRDGWPDLVTADSAAATASVLFNAAGSSLSPQPSVPVGGVPLRVALVDLDHDGVLDLAALDDSATPRLSAFQGLKVGSPWFDSAAVAAALPAGGVRGLAVGRFTADSRADLVTSLASPGRAVVVENRSGTPCARSSFAGAPRSYPAGSGPVSTAAADLDKDGRQDLVVASSFDASLRVLKNANGGFTAGVPIPLFPAPRAVAVADMNVDGNMDVVVAQGASGSGRVQVFLADFAGTLTPSGTQAAGDNLSSLVVGDFNGDGAPDVVAASEGTGQVFAFLGDGLGGLGSGTPFAVGSGPRALVAGFLDANATLDVAVANFLGDSVTVLSGNGTGGFGAPLTLTLAAGSNPRGIATADVDGDGRLDLVTADSGLGQVSVIRRDGVGNFLAPVVYPVGTNPSAVALVQLEGDSKPEIVVTASTALLEQMLTVLANNGGLFTPPLPGDRHAVRQAPQAITPFDADGDGLVDLAVPCRDGGSVVILLGRPPTLEAAPRVTVGDKPRAAAVGDFDGDGKLDLAVANSGDNSVSLLAGDGAGGLSAYGTLTAAAPEAIVSGDFNRDGRLDLGVSVRGATPSVAIFLGTGGGAFSLPTTVNVGAEPDDLVTGDFDLDGDLDIAVCDKVSPTGSVRILGNNGLGVFSAVGGVSVGDKPTSIVAADFDRDGDLDLAVANDLSDNVMILTYATGSFAVTQTLPLAGGDTSPVSLAVGDFDGNATIDLVAAAFGNFSRLHVYRNQTPSTPLFITPPVPYDAPYALQVVAAGDLNLDARPDLVALADGVSILRSLGGMNFDPPQTVVARYLPSAALIADFNRDGRPDIAVVNEGSDDVSLLLSTACQAQQLELSIQPNACQLGAPLFFLDAQVKAFDDGGNLASCATNTVTPSIVPGTGGGGVLSDPVPPDVVAVGLALAGGVASFTGNDTLAINAPGRRYRLQFQAGGLAPVHSRSFTLGVDATQIVGPTSVCPSSSGVYSLVPDPGYDSYSWLLDGLPHSFTPTATLTNPPIVLDQLHTLGVTARVDACTVTPSNLDVYFGTLASVTLDIQGASTVCVDCIGGSAKAIETGGGLVVSREWGYRTVSLGPITAFPGETGETYVLKGASFPSPGTYIVVVTTTATCGSTTSSEWTVTVSDLVSGEARYLAASSRGGASTGENRLLWVNTAAPLEIRIRWNKAPDGTNDCLPPSDLTTPPNNPPVTDEFSNNSPTADAKDTFLHTGLVLNTAYCYSVFVRDGTGWSPGRTVKARPFDSAGPVKWAYATGGSAIAPPTVSGDAILAMSNDRTVHALTRGSAGGVWPTAWMPAELAGVAHSRSPVVPFPLLLNGASNVLFVADDSLTGLLHAVNTGTGGPVWADQPQGKPVTGAPGGMFGQFAGVRDALFVGTRDNVSPNQFRALSVADGSLIEAYAGAGSGSQIGPINGGPAIDYANQRVYFASRRHLGSGKTLWCLDILPSGPVVFSHNWSRDLGDIVGSPVLRGTRVYVGTESGTIYSLDAASGGDDHIFTPSPADGPVKGFLFPDRRNDDMIFATTSKVWSISDDADPMTKNWEWAPGGPTPNPSIVLYRPQTNLVYVGAANGELYELDFTSASPSTAPAQNLQILGGGQGQVGAPSLDLGPPPLLIVGSEPGVLYAVEVPFP